MCCEREFVHESAWLQKAAAQGPRGSHFVKLPTIVCQKFVKTCQTVGAHPPLYKAKICQTVRTGYDHMSEGEGPPQNGGGEEDKNLQIWCDCDAFAPENTSSCGGLVVMP